ncbi:MAG: bifunctional methylenetetrahydrofolate dehydrogenase/methenyltetrahydrofolate cyclohydrolase, partial [Patescibacteria group bacterium]
DPKKDADGLSSSNMNALFKGEERVLPATTRGVLEMLSSYGFSPEKKKAVVIGRSFLVGRPTAMALVNRDATVTICHSNTEDLASEVRSAELVITATGVPGLVTSEMLHSEHVVIDVGTSLGEGGRLRGDVDRSVASGTVRAFSPVPGGVGPLTVASLFLNLMDLVEAENLPNNLT